MAQDPASASMPASLIGSTAQGRKPVCGGASGDGGGGLSQRCSAYTRGAKDDVARQTQENHAGPAGAGSRWCGRLAVQDAGGREDTARAELPRDGP